MSFSFDKLAPLLHKRIKICLNHFWVYSSAKDSLRRAKNVVFSLFCIFVDKPMGGALALSPPPLATLMILSGQKVRHGDIL